MSENSPVENIPTDDTFEALLDDYTREIATGWDATQERQNLIAYFHAMQNARDARLELQATRIAELESRQITPEMLKVWDDWQAIKRETVSETLAQAMSQDLRSDLWHAFNDMMDGDK